MKKILLLAILLSAHLALGFDAVLTDNTTLVLSGTAKFLGRKPTLHISAERAALMKFDLGLAPADVTAAQVANATLTVFVGGVTLPPSVTSGTVNLLQVSGTWSEAEIPSGLTLSSTLGQAIVTRESRNTFIQFDVTALVKQWIAQTAENDGVAIALDPGSPIDEIFGIDSKENLASSHPATLSIDFSADGAAGSTGPTGATGLAGSTGGTGSIGPAGLAGATGTPGLTGPAGPTGLAGVIGATGPSGAKGATGATGPSGLVGASGPTGATGLTGDDGEIGPRGPTGFQGIQGPSGIQGVQGPQGPSGLTGAAGPKGSTGSAGLTGATGLTGASGLPGPTGLTGLTGQPGLTGGAGPGPTGLTGLTGASGANGSDGATGPTGPSGDIGPTGPGEALAIGTVTAGGTTAAVTVAGTAPNQTLNFTLPNGQLPLDDTAIGANVLVSDTGGSNTGMGFQALVSNTTGINNAAFGFFAGSNITSGSNNIDLGDATAAGSSDDQPGESNTIRIGEASTQSAAYVAGIFGASSTDPATTFVYVDSVGHLVTSSTAQLNLPAGSITGADIAPGTVTGSDLAAGGIGSAQLGSNITLSGDTTIANEISLPATDSTGTTGVLVLGGSPFLSAYGTDNTFVGALAGNFSMTGSNNTATGYQAFTANTGGSENTAAGAQALVANSTGANNTAAGYQALAANTAGINNAAFGFLAGSNLTTGSNNIDLGDFNPGTGAPDDQPGESNTIRIGDSATQSAAYIAGIYGSASTSSSATLVYADSTGQLVTSSTANINFQGIVTGTFTGTFSGDGSGLTGVSVPASALTGTLSGSQIGNGAVGTAQLATASITSTDLAAGSVGTSKLAAGAVTTTDLAAGAVSAPVTISGTTQTAVGNTDYVTTSGSLTTISVPASANVGDVFEVTGDGAGGWQVVLAVGGWTDQTNAPGFAEWVGIASSADGTHLAAVVYDGGLYTSTNSGVNWTQQTNAPLPASPQWYCIASSADGTDLAAGVAGGAIYTSTNSGVNWTEQTNAPTSAYWQAIASSADGTHLAAAVGSAIYTSTDSGVDWIQQTNAPVAGWQAIASSADGTHLAAVVSGGGLYTSTNSGVNWTARTNGAPSSASTYWSSIASSADGTHLAAAVNYGGAIYTSTNSGASWTEQTNASTSARWTCIASSADGMHLAAGVQNGAIYISTDSGVTWTEQTSTRTNVVWTGIASSTDGTHLAAAANGSGIYTYSPPQYASGAQGTAEQFQYEGNGVWDPLTAPPTGQGLTVGTVTTGSAAVTIIGAAPNQVLNFTVPQGTTGATGATGPTGATGATGPTGSTGPQGSVGDYVDFYSTSEIVASGANIPFPGTNPAPVNSGPFLTSNGITTIINPGTYLVTFEAYISSPSSPANYQVNFQLNSVNAIATEPEIQVAASGNGELTETFVMVVLSPGSTLTIPAGQTTSITSSHLVILRLK